MIEKHELHPLVKLRLEQLLKALEARHECHADAEREITEAVVDAVIDPKETIPY